MIIVDSKTPLVRGRVRRVALAECSKCGVRGLAEGWDDEEAPEVWVALTGFAVPAECCDRVDWVNVEEDQ